MIIKTDQYPHKRKLFNHKLSCCVYAMQYLFPEKVGFITFATGECCDMTSCLSLFKAIDPKIRQIQTYSGDKKDTCYLLSEKGKWFASLPLLNLSPT